MKSRKKKGSPVATICNFDRDKDAVSSACQVCRVLDLEHAISSTCCDATRLPSDLTQFDAVYLAALVGEDSTTKLKILAELVQRMKPGAAVLIRSAHALRVLMYPVSIHGTSSGRSSQRTLTTESRRLRSPTN